MNGLGRMTSVIEDPTGLNYQTSYSYNALDDLLSVTQSGSRQRTFTYDWLSRLTSASNPESGTTCYATYSSGCQQTGGYDANGNLLTKRDARGITTTYSYDALNRVTAKVHSDGTPTVIFNYDVNNPFSLPATNPVGRLVSVWTGTNPQWAVWTAFSYDPVGRV